MLSALYVRSTLRHVVYFEPGPSSMKEYCLNRIKDGRYTFPCPKCKRIWEYFLVRHVASFDNKTRSDIEKRVVENHISQGLGYQQCPGCNTWCTPFNKGDIRLECPICSQSKGKPYDFCWACLRKWRRSSSLTRCGNGCDGKDPRLVILADAEKKLIDHIPGCPSIRACTKCGLLINLKEGCRHMICTGCKNEFCFLCLKPWESHNHDQCRVAPVQLLLSDDPFLSGLSLEDSRDEYVSQTVTTAPPANDGGCIILW